MFNRPLQSSNGHGTELSRSYSDGEMICQEGESNSEMFVIQSGSVRIFKNAPAPAARAPTPSAVPAASVELAVLHKGDFFGEMSLLEGLPRDASAQAVGDAQVLVMTPGALLVRLRRDPTFSFELLRRLSSRVRSLNARLLSALAERDSDSRERAVDPLLYSTEAKATETAP
ncbi:MAG TPA: cyclic nucleotide-binding domain-containing protein [Polyangiaceae bacterium]|nr:cyclic nucleotide-binding domain-containing protein [Polyangiaceae bacterium]